MTRHKAVKKEYLLVYVQAETCQQSKHRPIYNNNNNSNNNHNNKKNNDDDDEYGNNDNKFTFQLMMGKVRARQALTVLVLPTPSAASKARYMFSSPSSMLLASTVHMLTFCSCIITTHVRLYHLVIS